MRNVGCRITLLLAIGLALGIPVRGALQIEQIPTSLADLPLLDEQRGSAHRGDLILPRLEEGETAWSVVGEDRPRLAEPPPVRALILLPRSYGANYFLIRDQLERLGWVVATAGMEDESPPCPAYGGPLGCPPLQVDHRIPDLLDEPGFNLVLIAPASRSMPEPYGDLLGSPAVQRLIRRSIDREAAVGALCAGVGVLAEAGILDGVRVTGPAGLRPILEEAGALYQGPGLPPVVDGPVVTAVRGQYFSHQMGRALARAMEALHPPRLRAGIVKEREPSPGSEPIRTTIGDLPGWICRRPGSEAGSSLLPLEDGGALLVGNASSMGGSQADPVLIRVDPQGSWLWEKTLAGPDWEQILDGIPLPDGFLLAGWCSPGPQGSRDVLLLKTDRQGTPLWLRRFGGPGRDRARSLCPTRDGGFLLCGDTTSFGQGEEDLYLLKVDPDGNLLWSETLGGAGSDVGCSVSEARDGTLLVLGSSGSTGSPNRDMLLVRTDRRGREIWRRSYGGEPRDYDQGVAVREIPDGDIMILGHGSRGGSDLMDLHLIRTDPRGRPEWHRRLHRPFYQLADALALTEDGGTLLAATSLSPEDGRGQILVIRSDPEGRELWSRLLDTPASNRGADLRLAGEDGWLLLGTNRPEPSDPGDLLLVRGSRGPAS